jgi:hypothetical protein
VRRLALLAVFVLAVLAAGPMLGCGSQAQAGFVGLGSLESKETRRLGLPSATCLASWSDTLTITSVEEEEPLEPVFEDNRLEVSPGPGSVSQPASLGWFDSVLFSLLRARLPHWATDVMGASPSLQPFCADEPPPIHRSHSADLVCCGLQFHLPTPPILELFHPPRGS